MSRQSREYERSPPRLPVRSTITPAAIASAIHGPEQHKHDHEQANELRVARDQVEHAGHGVAGRVPVVLEPHARLGERREHLAVLERGDANGPRHGGDRLVPDLAVHRALHGEPDHLLHGSEDLARNEGGGRDEEQLHDPVPRVRAKAPLHGVGHAADHRRGREHEDERQQAQYQAN